ncbi:MAG: tRNA (adenosine(37)-N6)-dimethylallyltransferase MiaA [Clostridia bacterium]|nr:tRNA (adenosine(37)-N6)-dimethylallyltransferase MiaA [Clostridia bacterium]
MKQKPKVIILCGPTASGKTRLSIELAKAVQGEIISCDSMQIYQDMNIGTAKPSIEERQGIVHYLIDFVSPSTRYSVADFKKDACSAIKEILSHQKVPIIVGGTGLYVDSLTKNIEYPTIETDLNYRKELENKIEEQGLSFLYEEAKKIDNQAMQTISPNDKKRIMRVLEIFHQTKKTKTQLEQESRLEPPPYQYITFAINMDRKKLYDRINKRVDIMIEQGLIKEVENLRKKYQDFPTAMQGLGYKEVVSYLNGEMTKEEMIEKLKMETRRYAKRQLTWFRKDKDIIWLDGEEAIEKNIQCILEEYSER